MAKNRQRRRRSVPKQPAPLLSDAGARQAFFEKYVRYLEGLADYSQEKPRYGKNDPRELGWVIGRQIVSLYLVEMLLRVALERLGITKDTGTHNLAHLFRKLPQDRRNHVEKTYKLILNSEVQWTWDIHSTVESFLNFLGKSPIAKTRYPWQQQHEGVLYSPNSFRPLIYALYIGLHNYPYAKGFLDKRFDTHFKSFRDSRKNERFDRDGNRITE